MKPFRVIPVALSLLLLFTGSATANDERGLYLSAKFGSTDVEASLGDTFDQVIDGDEDSTTFEVGYKLSRFLGIQAGIHDFGNFGGPSCEVCEGESGAFGIEASTEAYSLSVVPQIDLIWRLSVFGKVGLVIWETEVDRVTGDTREFIDDFTEEDIIYGLGARFRLLGNLSVFAEWEKIADEIETISLGATLQF